MEEFWSQARAAFRDGLPAHLDRLTWDDGQVAAFQRDRLRRLLDHAIRHTPFHGRRLAGLDPGRVELADLAAIPPMTKHDVMDRFDEIVTDPRCRRAAAEAAIASTRTEAVPIDERWIVLASGGSSGKRALFVYDATAFAEYGLTLMRATMARIRAAGGPPPDGMTIALIAAESPIHATGCGPRLLDGGPVRLASVPVTLPFDAIIARLEALQPSSLLGYPSMLTRLARAKEAGRLSIAPRSVSTSSETLRPDQREIIRRGFAVPVVNTYGASEGLAGSSAPDDLVITFASDACIVEPVDEHDRPVPPGQPSSAALVTNLFNLTQPLIRYRLEDRLLVKPPQPGIGHLRAEVEGRTTDVLHYPHADIHPLVLNSPLERNPAVADHLVRQTSDGVDVDVLADDTLDTDGLVDELERALLAAGLADPHVTIRTVTAIARDAATGKRLQIVPIDSRAQD